MEKKQAILLSVESMEFKDKQHNGQVVALSKLSFLEIGTNDVMTFFVSDAKLLDFGIEDINDKCVYWDDELPQVDFTFSLELDMQKKGFNEYKLRLVNLVCSALK